MVEELNEEKRVCAFDCDGVLFINEDAVDTIDTSKHQLGGWINTASTTGKNTRIALINPKRLRLLFEEVSKIADIMFMSAGFWRERSIKLILCTELKLTMACCLKILNAPFLTPDNVKQYFPETPLYDIPRKKLKALWLEGYRKEHPEMRYRIIIIVDDNPQQLDSFEGDEKVIRIHATTHKHYTDMISNPEAFFDATLKALGKTKLSAAAKPFFNSAFMAEEELTEGVSKLALK